MFAVVGGEPNAYPFSDTKSMCQLPWATHSLCAHGRLGFRSHLPHYP